MHTEHLQNVRPSWVAFGWFIGAAVTAFLLFALIAVGLVDTGGEGGGFWVLLAMFLGFVAAGWFTGVRTGEAPILHAVGIGLFSLVVWFLANLLLGEPLGAETWGATSPAFASGVVLLQIAAAALGGRIATRAARAATAPGV